MQIPPRFSVIIPVFNSLQHIRASLDSVTAAIARYQNAELVVVDNGSTDGSYELLLRDYAQGAKIFQKKGVSIGALRNLGARAVSGDYLAFIDSDCVIDSDYFEKASSVLATLDAAATGSRYALPPQPNWIEVTWELLHRRPNDSYVPYLNSGNFIIARELFEKVGGFSETLVTGEDSEICSRLTAAGYKIYDSRQIRAVHLGNPKTLRAFVRKQVWHGLGAFGSARIYWFDRPLLLTFGHLLFTAAGIANLLMAWASWPWRVMVFFAATLISPALAVAYRAFQTGKLARPFRSTLLYWLFLSSRTYSLFLIASNSGRRPGWLL
jgi:glycosyltransferase involved in cell wall biosynthesis